MKTLALSFSLGFAATSAKAADTVYTATTTGATNWTTANWTTAVPTNNPGDVARYTGTALGTYTLDVDVTIGVLRSAAGGGGWTILSNGANVFTMDGTGLSAGTGATTGTQDFGNAGVAAIADNNGNASAARVFTVGTTAAPLTINMATDLDVGIIALTGSGFNTAGTINNTSGGAKTLTFRENSNAGSAGAPQMGIASSIGAGGNSTIAIVNAGTGGNGAARGVVTLSGVLGSNVANITQNSATSALTISNAGNTYAGGTTVNAGTLSVTATGVLGTGNVTAADLPGVILTLANNNAIADSAILNFGHSATINLNAANGTSETVAAIFDSTTNTTFNTPGTYTAAQLNAQFGVPGTPISTFISSLGETITIAPVPEPSTWAMLLGGAGVLTVFERLRGRRRA